jgi:type IV pilus assembly protein PilA
MKTELKAKFLQHILNKKKNEEGFTLIELLVVIIIIGILSAIALPSFLNQASKARQSEAKTYVGSINRGMQAFYLENQNSFTTVVTELSLGIAPSTENYKYEIESTKPSDFATVKARATNKALKSYAGIVFTSDQTVSTIKETVTMALLCEAKTPLATDTPAGEAITAIAANVTNRTTACAGLTPSMKTIE